MDKEDVVCIHTYIYNGIIYIYTQYCSAIKERMNNAICSNMDGSRHYNKWNQTKTNIISHVKSKKIYNELIYKTETRLTDIENKLTVTKGQDRWEG